MPEQNVHPGLVAGAVVVVVVEGSPAFSSNVMAGDIIVAVNGKTVKNAEQAWALMKESDMSERSTLHVIRRGVQREIIIKF